MKKVVMDYNEFISKINFKKDALNKEIVRDEVIKLWKQTGGFSGADWNEIRERLKKKYSSPADQDIIDEFLAEIE